MSNAEDVETARRALGARLAQYRKAAGLSQPRLALLIGYGRSTIANAETGRRPAARDFWERCEQLLRAGGALTRQYDELDACWLRLGYPERAIKLYDATLPTLPSVYRRDRGVALSRYALAQLTAGRPDQAAHAASEALSIALDVGSLRTRHQVQAIGRRLTSHRRLTPVAQLLDELAVATAP